MASRLASEELVSRIDLLYDVAKLNGSIVTIEDVSSLLSSYLSPEELREVFISDPRMRRKYALKSDFIIGRGESESISQERTNRIRALSNLIFAKGISRRLKSSSSLIIAIAGSTSYGSVKPHDDLDLFCVTERDSLWVFLTRSLLLLRFMRLRFKNLPAICLSYVADSGYAEKAFLQERDPLFARDALQAVVLDGQNQYKKLLLQGSWMRDFFPRIYDFRATSPKSWSNETGASPSVMAKVLNRFLFHTIGTYIRIKSWVANRKFSIEGRNWRLFEAEIRQDHCIYESVRYTKIRALYSQLSSETG